MGLRQIYDGLISALSGRPQWGMQTGRPYLPNYLTDQDIDACFRGSWLMRKIVTKPATEMTREGRDWQTDKATIEKLEAEEKRLGIWGKLQKAEVLRGLGGAGMVLFVDGDAQESELDPKRVRVGKLAAVHVWHRSCFTLGPEIVDWTSPWFGHPSFYEMRLGAAGKDQPIRFHPSRVVAFRGKPISGASMTMGFADRWWWGDSTVEVVKEAVDNVHIGENGFAKLIRRAAIRRLSVPGLFERVSTSDTEDAFKKRVSAIALGESSDDITWLDGGNGEGKGAETIADAQVTWTGIPDIKSSNLAVAAAAANMPATVLLGKSPDGMNSTGKGDQALWEQEVKARQDLELRPCIDQIDAALVPSALGAQPADLWWKFAPLSTPTEAEEATTFKTWTDGIVALQGSALLPDRALSKGVQNTLSERAWISGIDDALADIPEAERFPSLTAERKPDPQGVEGGDPTSAGGGGEAPARRAANDAATGIKEGDWVEFDSDWQTEKGPSSGKVVSVEGGMVTIAHSDDPGEVFEVAALTVKQITEHYRGGTLWVFDERPEGGEA